MLKILGLIIFGLMGFGLYLDWQVALIIILAAYLHNIYKQLSDETAP